MRIAAFGIALVLAGGLAIAVGNSSELEPGLAPNPEPETKKATFAGGCFWCMEPPFDEVDGVLSTTSGYTGGRIENPSYEQVSTGGTGHIEAVQIAYDPTKVSYETLLEIFWRNVDPTDGGGQFCDRGEQYTTAIFAHDEEQERLAEASKKAISQSGALDDPIVTPIRPAAVFYDAEEYHQDYYLKNKLRYKFYRLSCGRDRRLKQLWGEPSTD